jgi:ankyrin repeat protein
MSRWWIGGHREVAEVLLGKGASIVMQAGNGLTALMCASAVGHREVAEVLLGKGVRPFLLQEFRNSYYMGFAPSYYRNLGIPIIFTYTS